ncbi:MAG: methyl-accepting chemotaxis protein [Lachnospiraceae bacterium]|nr:methyl-accepting chemotaxis protein [Lachnospiraceae bacterium]
MKLKKKIFMLTVCPVLLVGVVVILITLTVVRGALMEEIEDSLKGAATATYAAYDQNSGQYIQAENGDVWKGSYNISKSESIVDSIKEKSGVEVTFFYGSQRIMTSAVDKKGERILKSPAGDKIVQKVLKEGKEYFSEAVSIDGTLHYGYYIPVYQEGEEEPLGMIFVGSNKAQKDAAMNQILGTVIAVVLLVMLLCIAAAVIFSVSLTRPLQKGIGAVQAVAKGNLKTDIEEKSLQRKDEIGDLSRSIVELQSEMTKSIEKIADNSGAVMQASRELEDTARDAVSSMEEVENAVNSIAQSAEVQAEISRKTSDNVTVMGEKILETTKEVEQMEQNADAMRNSEERNAQTLQKLLDSNEQVQQLIQEISAQTKKTNDSARKIREVTDMIASIAEETNLLSLNASIEAARAGESGKGFAVVASQIQQLAVQSNESSKRIEEIIKQLLQDSDEAVETMEKVTDTISAQSGNMEETRHASAEVMEKLRQSLSSMKVIEDRVTYLDHSRKEIVDTVTELLDIATRNAATTQQVCATANMVTGTFEQVEGSTQSLREVANGLEESMQHFHC